MGDLTLRDISARCHKVAVSKGWDATVSGSDAGGKLAMKLLLVVSEIVEALEEFRNHHEIDEVYVGEGGKPEGIPIELADAVIRIFDLCEANGIDLEAAILDKLDYNAGRPYRHGGKRA